MFDDRLSVYYCKVYFDFACFDFVPPNEDILRDLFMYNSSFYPDNLVSTYTRPVFSLFTYMHEVHRIVCEQDR